MGLGSALSRILKNNHTTIHLRLQIHANPSPITPTRFWGAPWCTTPWFSCVINLMDIANGKANGECPRFLVLKASRKPTF